MREPEQDVIGKRIARLLAAELTERASKREFGVVVHDVDPLDSATLLNALAERLEAGALELHLALVGESAAVAQALKQHKAWKNRLSADEEAAVGWRNKKKRMIAVVARRPLSKEASLRSFPRVDEHSLYVRLCEEEKKGELPTFLHLLWEALAKLADAVPLASLVAYAEAIRELPQKDQSLKAAKLVYHLGLLPDEHLADQTSERVIAKRLRANAELLGEIRLADQDEWKRVRDNIHRLPGGERSSAERLRSKLQQASSAGAAALAGIDFTDSDSLWRGKRRTAGVAGASSKAQADEVTRPEHCVAALLLDRQHQQLRDVADEITQIVQKAMSEGGERIEEELNKLKQDGRRAVLAAEPGLIQLVRDSSTDAAWGGRYTVSTDRIDTLCEPTARTDFRPLEFAALRLRLQEFVDADLLPGTVATLAERLASLRSELLKYAGELTVSPIAFLAGNQDARQTAVSYLAIYEQLLQAIQVSYPAARGEAEEQADALVAWLLSMEIYVFRSESTLRAVLSPLHPLHLWRSVFVVSELLGTVQELGPQERDALQVAAADELHLLQVAFLPAAAAGSERACLLGLAGELGRLPLYREAPRGIYEPHGSRTVAHLAQLLAQLRPYARPGLQVVLVNAPRPAVFVEALLAQLARLGLETRETYYGLHLRLRYTSEDARGWAAELDELSDEATEALAMGRERGIASLSVEPRPLTWEALGTELEARPAHLTVIVDPFEVRTSPLARTGLHRLSPWVLTREYKYNKLGKEITVVPVAESFVFGTYQGTVGLLDPALKQKNPANLPQVAKVRDHLNRIAASSTWTAVLDPHMVSLARLGEAELIERRMDGTRQVTCYARDLSPYTRQLDKQLRKTHFTADSATLTQLVRELAALEPAGILSLGTASNEGRGVKGSLGKLIATRWYRRQEPSGLAVSLDTREGRQWLVAGRASRVQADLLGLREVQGSIMIDVIEVKAHEDEEPYRVDSEGVIHGQSVAQVLATLRAIAEIFATDSDTSPLVRPRREVLRDHLYTAVLRDADPAFMQRWYSLLNDIFSGDTPVRLAGRIIHVRLASVADHPPAVYKTAEGLPILVETMSAQDVGLVLNALRGAKEPAMAEAGAAADFASPELALDPKEVVERFAPKPSPVEPRPLAPDQSQRADAAASEDRLAYGPTRKHMEATDTAEHVFLAPPVTPSAANAPPVRVQSPDSAVAGSSSPGSSMGTSHSVEILLGHERPSARPALWQPGRQSNGFFLILGASGSGKTETLKVLTDGVCRAGVPVLLFDFHGDVKVEGFRSELLSHGPSSRIGLNPLELDATDTEHGPYLQRQVIKELITGAVRLGHRQSSALSKALQEAYRRAGISDEDPSTWTREPPTFASVDKIFGEWLDDDSQKASHSSIEGCRAALQEIFEHPLFSRQPRLPLSQILREWTRLDLSPLSDSVRLIVTDTLLRKVFRSLRAQGPIPVQPAGDHERFRLFVVIDEAKILSLGTSDRDRDRSGAILNTLITEARKFGLGMILATQMAEHFSSEVRANAASWLVLRPLDIREAKKNAPNVQVEPEDLMQLQGGGDGYLRDRSSPRARRVQVRPRTVTAPLARATERTA